MSSIPSAGRTSAVLLDTDYDPHIFHPYSDYIPPAKDGRVPSPPFITRPFRPRSSSNSMGENLSGHTPQQSGSHEPLLASYNHASRPSTGGTLPPQHLSDASIDPPAMSDRPLSLSSVQYSSEGDHRLDPILRQRFQDDADSSRDLRDEEDYSRPVLGVCAILLWCYLSHLLIFSIGSKYTWCLKQGIFYTMTLLSPGYFHLYHYDNFAFYWTLEKSHHCGPVSMDSWNTGSSRILYVFRQKSYTVLVEPHHRHDLPLYFHLMNKKSMNLFHHSFIYSLAWPRVKTSVRRWKHMYSRS